MRGTGTTHEAPPLHAHVLSDERRRGLLITLPLLGAIFLLSTRMQSGLSGNPLFGEIALWSAGIALLLIAVALWFRWISHDLGATVTITLVAGLMLIRTVLTFLGNPEENPGSALFAPFFAYLPAFYVLTVLLLPYPQSKNFGVFAWLLIAAITVAGGSRYWFLRSPPPMLYGLLLYITLGNGLFVALIYGWARQQKILLGHYADLVHSERTARGALQMTERRFRSVFEQAAVGVALIDDKGGLTEVNTRLCEIIGYSQSELFEIQLSELTFPEDLPALAERSRALAANEIDSYSIERPLRAKDGSAVWVHVFVRKAQGDASQPAHVVLIVIDINERKRAEQQVLEHQRVREFHFENTPMAVIEWTPDLRVKRWSARAETMFGWRADEVIGRSPLEWRFIYDDDRDATERVITKLFSGTETLVTNLNRNYHKDGSTVWCRWYNSLLRDENGQSISFFSIVDDVSDQQTATAALNESETRFRSIFEQASVGITMLDHDGRWLAVNQRFCDIVGYTSDELHQRTWESLSHPADVGLEQSQSQRIFDGDIPHHSLEKRFLHKSGNVIWAMVFVRCIEATRRAPKCFVRIVEDITERKLAEARVQQLTADLEKTVIERTQQLQRTMRSWAERNNELNLLAEMMGVLPAARDTREGSQIVARFLPRLFSRCSGAIYLEAGTPDHFPLLTQWRIDKILQASLVAEDCWALRRGQVLRIEDPGDPLLCPHINAVHGAQEPHVCVPVMALGDAVGMIYLQWSERVGAEYLPPDPVLLATVAEQIGLAIGNVRLREELRRQAILDPLTSLYNRRHFDECLVRRIAKQKQADERFALLMIDLDHFKTINDSYGHDSGDEVLRVVAALLKRIVSSDETVFRLGGEEFVLLLDNEDGSNGLNQAERIRREVEKLRIVHKGHMLNEITVSIGIACCPDDTDDAVSLMQLADAALYVAKRGGRNRIDYAGTAYKLTELSALPITAARPFEYPPIEDNF
ncbi:MAG: PAS domain S-box protein [Nevskia sp.]|jgi:diguanylate cyclase (GGDEF)-like protein/PAS domain S-box-containing protein|nr:PAS domain S-box protein [Nevskia sp.]